MKWIRNLLLSAALVITTGNALANEPAAVININTATAEELAELKGIGLKKAEAIISYREQRGLFTSVEELILVKGIGENTVAKNRALLATTGE